MTSLHHICRVCLPLKQPHHRLYSTAAAQVSSFTGSISKRPRNNTQRSSDYLKTDSRKSWPSWNQSSSVQNNLRKDVLRGFGFRETIFRIPYPVKNNSDQQALVDEFHLLTKQVNSQFLIDMGFTRLEMFLSELAISNKKLQPEHYAVLSDISITYFQTCNFKDMLKLTDMLYVLRALSADYIRLFLKQVEVKWSNLNLDNSKLLQLLFYIGMFRNASDKLLGQIEIYLEEQINSVGELNSFTTSQLGLICNTFFATNYAFKSYMLLEAIANRVSSAEDFDQIKLYLITNIMKAMHHAGYNKVKFYDTVALKLCQSKMITNDSGLSNLSNIISAFASNRYAHEELFEKVIAHAENIVRHNSRYQPRMKDLARIISSCLKLQLPVSDVLVAELKNQLEADSTLRILYPQQYIEALVALTENGVYLPYQLEYVFSSDVPKLIADQEFQRIQLDKLTELQCPDYTGNRLPSADVMKFVSFRNAKRGLDLHLRQGLAATWLTLEELLGGKEYVKCHYITDFTRILDLEVRLNQVGDLQPWNQVHDMSPGEESLRVKLHRKLQQVKEVEQQQGVLAELLREHKRHIPNRMEAPNQHFWPNYEGQSSSTFNVKSPARVTIKLLSDNQYIVNKPLLLGTHQTEVNALNKMGYHVKLICPHDATRIDEATSEERKSLVKVLILKPIQKSLYLFHQSMQTDSTFSKGQTEISQTCKSIK